MSEWSPLPAAGRGGSLEDGAQARAWQGQHRGVRSQADPFRAGGNGTVGGQAARVEDVEDEAWLLAARVSLGVQGGQAAEVSAPAGGVVPRAIHRNDRRGADGTDPGARWGGR